MFRHNILAVMAIAVTGMSSCVSGSQLYSGETATWRNVLNAQDTRSNSERVNDLEISRKYNIAKLPPNNDPYGNGIIYSRSLAEYYMQQAGVASGAKDAVALGLIAAAGVATGGLLYDANLNLIKGAGLAAGSLTVLNTYGRPEETETALLSAADALICIANAAESAPNLASDPAAQSALFDATLKVRVTLRKRIARKIIDYGTLLDTFKAAGERTRKSGGAENFVPMDVEQLRARFAECQLRAAA